MKTQSISEFKRIFSAARWFICAMPVCGWLVRNRITFLFPPLGDSAQTGLALTVATLVTGTAALLPWKLDLLKIRSPLLILSFLCAVGSSLPYFSLCQRYVISTSLPGKHPLIVSIGNVRSKFALENFQGSTDAEMLQAMGPYEDEVQKLWTGDSILSVRFRLFLSYLGWLIPLNLILGIFAKTERNSQNPIGVRPSKRSTPPRQG